ncbi:MAG: SAM-dependent methyltransferase, partial [Acidimicrobiia bacterium]
ADLSFISLRLVAPALAGVLTAATAEAVLLIKPQFEASRKEVGRGGIVSDPAVHRRVLDTVATALAAEGLGIVGVMASPLRGASGNVEFLGHFRPLGPGEVPAPDGFEPDRFEAAVAEGHALC